uniref:Uncharacterized protein n=1 Tax=Rhizophagus irregularis (strain DAOM 181602 / DAOM 197198 / MUCL 43194) TaxID=747089 RepID=U9SUL1_RHIID
MEGPVEDGKKQPFPRHRNSEKNKDRPEKLDYKTAADKLTRCLRDIVSTSVSADTIRQALILQEKLRQRRRVKIMQKNLHDQEKVINVMTNEHRGIKEKQFT